MPVPGVPTHGTRAGAVPAGPFRFGSALESPAGSWYCPPGGQDVHAAIRDGWSGPLAARGIPIPGSPRKRTLVVEVAHHGAPAGSLPAPRRITHAHVSNWVGR